MTRPRVILADDHKMVMEGLKKLLSDECDIIAMVENAHALLDAVERFCPDLIIADISMPGLSGIDAVERITKAHKQIKAIILTMHPDVAYAKRAFKAGASGYVLKRSAPDELITAIRAALQDRIYVTPLIAGQLLECYEKGGRAQDNSSAGLTPRQREVLGLLAEGSSVKEIAAILTISMKTVEYHKYQMMDMLGIKTMAELIRYAVKHGIIEA